MQPNKKHLLKRYFTFIPRERRAIFLLVTLIFLFFILPYIFPAIVKPKPEAVKGNINQPKSAGKISGHTILPEDKIFVQNTTSLSDSRLFYFDPNTATLKDWKALGIPEKTAQTIIRYRLKGGKFTWPEDIKKIWGLSAQIADQLIPFIRIKSDAHAIRSKMIVENSVPVNQYPKIKIDINSARQEDWEKLNGIGPVMAARILKFREKLGGFISVEQIAETYGLKDSIFQQIRSNLYFTDNNFAKININKSDIEQLHKHPYINYKTARAIVAYREQHGAYLMVSDLKKIESIAPEAYQKMEKYLTIE